MGLGFREGAVVSSPSAVASQITARLARLEQFTHSYVTRTQAAFEDLLGLLAEVHDELKQLAEDGAAAAAARREQL